MPNTHEPPAGCGAGKIEFDGSITRAITPWGQEREFDCPVAAIGWLAGAIEGAKQARREELQGGFR